jgi:hypothetical protein
MEVLKRRAQVALKVLGVDTQKTARAISTFPAYLRAARTYRAFEIGRFAFDVREIFPVLGDFEGSTRATHQQAALWAARKIVAARPSRHLDVGSPVDGLVAHLLAHMPVEIVAAHAPELTTRGLLFTQDDPMRLTRIPQGSVPSLSSIHAVERVGLEHDALDPNGWWIAMRSLARVLAPGGRLYFAVPIGRERVRFNAHRVFAPETVLVAFQGLRLVSFSAVTDRGTLLEDTDPACFTDAHYACGLFELTK